MSPTVRRVAIYGLTAAILVAGAVWAFRPRPELVDVAVVEARPLRVTVEEDGRTRVRDLYTVSAPVAGRLNRVDLEVGDPVQAGVTELANIAPSDPAFLDVRASAQASAQVKAAEASVSEAVARIEQAEAQLAFAEKERDRMDQLHAEGVISAARFEQADRDWRNARAALDSARAALRARRMDLEVARAATIVPDGTGNDGNGCCIRVMAPTTGQVLKVHQKSAKVVASGTPLVDIGDDTDLEVVADFLSVDAVKIRPGARAEFVGFGGERPIEGSVRRVEPTGFTKVSALGVEEQRVNVILDIDGKGALAAGLGHGYRLVARVEVWTSDGPTLSVPIDALFRAGEDWAVFAVRDGAAVLTRVEIGRRNTHHAQVLGGLSAGDAVVVHPGRAIEDGTPVMRREG